jgi:hypothetical protein
MPNRREAGRSDAHEIRQMEAAVASLPTKSAKIRALHAAGYSRSRIADFLRIRYQHVRNVLVADEATRGKETPSRPESVEAPGEAGVDAPIHGRCVVDEQGRIAIPAALIPQLDAKPGATIPWRYEDGELKLMSREAGIRFAQALIADFAQERPGNWSDDLIARRRAEARKEAAERRHG